MTLQRFCALCGVSRTTAWRLRRRGWITTVNIAGKNYVPASAIEEFNRRAAAGDLATLPDETAATTSPLS